MPDPGLSPRELGMQHAEMLKRGEDPQDNPYSGVLDQLMNSLNKAVGGDMMQGILDAPGEGLAEALDRDKANLPADIGGPDAGYGQEPRASTPEDIIQGAIERTTSNKDAARELASQSDYSSSDRNRINNIWTQTLDSFVPDEQFYEAPLPSKSSIDPDFKGVDIYDSYLTPFERALEAVTGEATRSDAGRNISESNRIHDYVFNPPEGFDEGVPMPYNQLISPKNDRGFMTPGDMKGYTLNQDPEEKFRGPIVGKSDTWGPHANVIGKEADKIEKELLKSDMTAEETMDAILAAGDSIESVIDSIKFSMELTGKTKEDEEYLRKELINHLAWRMASEKFSGWGPNVAMRGEGGADEQGQIAGNLRRGGSDSKFLGAPSVNADEKGFIDSRVDPSNTAEWSGGVELGRKGGTGVKLGREGGTGVDLRSKVAPEEQDTNKSGFIPTRKPEVTPDLDTDKLKDAIHVRESNVKEYDAESPSGTYIGRYQMGRELLLEYGVDVEKAGVKSSGDSLTLAEFKADHNLQEEIMDKHIKRVRKWLFDSKFIDRNTSKKKVAGLISGAQLGFGHLKRFLNEGINFKDANGVSIKEFIKLGEESQK
jgi:hypothetical protein